MLGIKQNTNTNNLKAVKQEYQSLPKIFKTLLITAWICFLVMLVMTFTNNDLAIFGVYGVAGIFISLKTLDE